MVTVLAYEDVYLYADGSYIVMMRMKMFLADDNDVEKAETEYSLRSDSFAWQALFTVLDRCSSLTTMMTKI